MDSYDLFSAMSGAAEELVARSDYRVKHRKQGFTFLLTAAACLAILIIGIVALPPRTAPEVLSTQPPISASETDPVGSEPVDINHNGPLKLSGSDVGTLNVIQLSHIAQERTMPKFLIYIDTRNYYPADDGSSIYIYQKNRTEDKPACWLTITWEADSTVQQVLQQQRSILTDTMESVTVSDRNSLLDGPMIHGSNGSSWDAAQTEVYIVSDQQGGVFTLTLQYYLDDTDGHAIRFRDMLQTFEIVTDNKLLPDWMADLYSCTDNFTTAFLKNDFSDVQDLISKDAQVYTYDGDVLAGTRVLKTHYTVDDDTNPTSAQVSVRHKYLENDAYDYITIELKYTDGKWQVIGAGVER